MKRLLCYWRTRHFYQLHDLMGLKQCLICNEIRDMGVDANTTL